MRIKKRVAAVLILLAKTERESLYLVCAEGGMEVIKAQLAALFSRSAGRKGSNWLNSARDGSMYVFMAGNGKDSW